MVPSVFPIPPGPKAAPDDHTANTMFGGRYLSQNKYFFTALYFLMDLLSAQLSIDVIHII